MKRSIFPLLLLVFSCLDNVQAQTIWTQRTDRVELKLEYLLPNFPSRDPGHEFTSQILTADWRVLMGKSLFVILETAMTWASQSYPYASVSKKGLGNLFVGVEIGNIDFRVFGELGAQPFVKQDLGASELSRYYGDFDRFEGFEKKLAFCFPSATLRHFSQKEV